MASHYTAPALKQEKPFAKYIAPVYGARTWDEVEPLFDDAFDAECVFVTADGEMNKKQWAEMAQELVATGATASGFKVTGEEGESRYLRSHHRQGTPPHDREGTLKDGRLVKVEPVDAAVYSEMVERSQ